MARKYTVEDVIRDLTADQHAELVRRLHALPPEGLLTTREAVVYLRVNPNTLHAWRSRGVGPAFEGRGYMVRYRKACLDAFMRTGATDGKAAA